MDGFARRLLAWFDRHGRHGLPWHHRPTRYRIWIAEIMLQQTQVRTVIPYFERFVERFPDLATLAAADTDDVLALWSGLGYYSRARNLHRAARECVQRHSGRLPRDFDALCALPGIGRSTAGAILAQADGLAYPILDGNAKRVLARYHAVAGWPGRTAVARELWSHAERHTPQERVRDYTQAIMDLGATICLRRRPLCRACPQRGHCRAHAQGRPEEYPGAKPRREQPLHRTQMLLLRDDAGRLLLERRPPSGVWGGLWALPECPDDGEPVAHCRERLGLCLEDCRAYASFTHTFTHFRLHITPLRARAMPIDDVIMDDGDRCWRTPDAALALGLPKPVRYLIEQETQHP